MAGNPNKLDELLALASKKLGTTPDKLKQTLQSGKVEDAVKMMNPTDAAKLQKVLENPDKARAVLQGQGEKLVRKLTEEK